MPRGSRLPPSLWRGPRPCSRCSAPAASRSLPARPRRRRRSCSRRWCSTRRSARRWRTAPGSLSRSGWCGSRRARLSTITSRLFTRPVPFNPLAAMVLWALAVWWDWVAIVTWPVVLAAFRRRLQSRGTRALDSRVDAARRGRFRGALRVDGPHGRRGHSRRVAAVTWRDALWAAFDARPRMPGGSYAAPELTMRIGNLLIVLSAVGLVFGASGGGGGGRCCSRPAWPVSVALIYSEWQAEVFRFSSWALAPLSAVGLTWVAAQGRRPLVITSMLGAIAMMETIVSGSRSVEGLGRARLSRWAGRCARAAGARSAAAV